MGKTRSFINRKEATTYSVVHRSQQDGEHGVYDVPSEFVLLEQKRPNVHGKKVPDAVTSSGFNNDGYDYNKHLRSMGGGTFVDSAGNASTTQLGRAAVPREALSRDDLAEIPRLYEAVTIEEKGMDPELYAALFAENDDGGFEEIDDDFVMDATKVDLNAPEAFDYDAHVARLLKNCGDGHLHDHLKQDSDDEEEGDEDVRRAGRDDVEAAFEAALAGYDDSDMDDGDDDVEGPDDEDDDDDDDMGVERLRLDGEVMDGMLDEALKSQKRDVDKEVAFWATAPKRNYEISVDDGDEEEVDVDAEITAEYAALDQVRFDSEEKFDCETILSTLSNLDNHPATLVDDDDDEDSKKRRAKSELKRLALRGLAPRLATLDEATAGGGAAPVGAAPVVGAADSDVSDDDETVATVNTVRTKDETKEDKSKRKAFAKELSRKRRVEKKATKEEWKAAVSLAPVKHMAPPSVFKF